MTMSSSIEVSIGQIANLPLPWGWVETEVKKTEYDLWSQRTFTHTRVPGVRLHVFHRGRPMTERSGKCFRECLAATPHSVTAEELADLQEVLRDAALPGAFNVTTAGTENLNGRHVLSITGTWTASGESCASIFIDAGDEGSQVQEIHLVGSPEPFRLVLTPASEVIRSIQWKKGQQTP